MYPRDLNLVLEQWLDKKEILILYGARQVGKTTLLKEMLKNRQNAIMLNCELPIVSDILESKDLARIRAIFEEKKIIVLDEAQKISEIGNVLKLIYDELPKYKIIATGSSSFDLANKIIEPLTGRNIKFKLYPLSVNEIKQKNTWLWVMENLNSLLVFGSYPGIIDLNISDKKIKLPELASDYLFKDILIHENIKNPALIRKLLKALALQIGSQVSTNELSNMLGVTRQTIEKYIYLLEKCFVIFSLPSFSSNLRNEMKKSRKFYFYDNGIRNAIINDFSLLQNRTDIGALWENYCISERIKINKPNTNVYFWRTYDGAEIDMIEEHNGKLTAFEFKWKKKRKTKIPESFSEKYGLNDLIIVAPTNLQDLLN